MAQILQVVLLAAVAYLVLVAVKSFMSVMEDYSQATEMLLPDLYDGPNIIYQDPNTTGAITILPSVNAPAGLEFSYSCFLLINKTTFQAGTNGLRHVFHKGSASYKPLMCPGVYVKNNTNTLVVYMNEAEHWDTHCEITNIPVGKFFHLAIVVRNRNVDVYINGNVAHRMTLASVPRQNFGDVYVFKNDPYTDPAAGSSFKVAGAADGLISRLLYTGYALNYEQIDRQMRAGPSTKLVSSGTQSLPPYLADNWWVAHS